MQNRSTGHQAENVGRRPQWYGEQDESPGRTTRSDGAAMTMAARVTRQKRVLEKEAGTAPRTVRSRWSELSFTVSVARVGSCGSQHAPPWNQDEIESEIFRPTPTRR